MNLQEQVISGRSVFNGQETLRSVEARKEFGDKVADLIRALPDRVFDAACNGENEVVLDTSPVTDFVKYSPRNRGDLFGGISLWWGNRIPVKGTPAQVLHEALGAEGIKFRTYQPENSENIETYLVLSDLILDTNLTVR